MVGEALAAEIGLGEAAALDHHPPGAVQHEDAFAARRPWSGRFGRLRASAFWSCLVLLLANAQNAADGVDQIGAVEGVEMEV